MTSSPIILSVKNYSAYNHIRNSVIKYKLPSHNYYELHCVNNALNTSLYNKYGSPVTSPKTIPQYNGDLWIFSKGFNDEKGVFPPEYRSGMFFSFDEKKGTGFLFNNLILYGLIETCFKPRRLFLFSCYQGIYLQNYIEGIPSLECATGFAHTADISKANEELTKYFKDIPNYKMENIIERV